MRGRTQQCSSKHKAALLYMWSVLGLSDCRVHISKANRNSILGKFVLSYMNRPFAKRRMLKNTNEIVTRVILDDANVIKDQKTPLVEIRRDVLIPLASERVVGYCCFKRRDVLNQCLEFNGRIIRSE